MRVGRSSSDYQNNCWLVKRRRQLAVATAIAAVTLGLSSSLLADRIWTGVGGNAWNTTTNNWNNGSGSATWDSQVATFNTTSTTSLLIAAGGVSATGLTFNATGYIIGGSGKLTLNDSATVTTTTSTHTATLNAVLTGGAAGTTYFTKAGAGTLVLGGANEFLGNLSLTGGTLSFSNDNQFGATTSDHTIAFGGNATLKYTNTAAATLGATRLFSVTGDNNTFDIGANSSVIFRLNTAGQLSGSGVLSKTGTGVLEVGNSNAGLTDGSVLNINAGTLRLTNASATTTFLGSAALGLAGGSTLDIRTNGATTQDNALTVSGSGTATLMVGRVVTGVGHTLTMGDLTLAGPTFNLRPVNLTTNTAYGATFSAVSLKSDTVIDVGPNGTGVGTLTLGDIAQDLVSRKITKKGAGMLVLTGASDHKGLTSIEVGTVRVTHPNALGAGSGITVVYPGAVLDVQTDIVGETVFPQSGIQTGIAGSGFLLNSGSTDGSLDSGMELQPNSLIGVWGSGDLTLSGVLQGEDLVKGGTGTGALVLANSGNLVARVSVIAGTLRVAANNSVGVNELQVGKDQGEAATFQLGGTSGGLTLSNPVTVSTAAGMITLGGTNTSGTNTFAGLVTLERSVTLDAAAGGTLLFSGGFLANSAAFDLAKSGEGTVIISGAGLNNFAGIATIQSGTLQFASASALGAGQFVLGDSSRSSDAQLTFAAAGNIANAIVIDAGSNGTAIVTGLHSAGQLNLASPIALTKNLSIRQAAGGTFKLSGVLSGVGGLTLGGAGLEAGVPSTELASHILLTAANTYAGETSILAGTLEIAGSLGNTAVYVGDGITSGRARLMGAGLIANLSANAITIEKGGTIAPGNGTGKLTTGKQIWQGGGTYEWEIANPAGAAGTDWDLLELNAAGLVFGATAEEPFQIRVIRAGGAMTAGEFEATQWFTIAHAGSISVLTSDVLTILDATGDQTWEARTAAAANGGVNLQVRALAVPEPGNVVTLAAMGVGMLATRRRRTRYRPNSAS